MKHLDKRTCIEAEAWYHAVGQLPRWYLPLPVIIEGLHERLRWAARKRDEQDS